MCSVISYLQYVKDKLCYLLYFVCFYVSQLGLHTSRTSSEKRIQISDTKVTYSMKLFNLDSSRKTVYRKTDE
jgi:hypothetical protein